ncbi:Hypothetical protein SMAX5B_016278 [Scophthalmus maximus]|uniref:Uncharacterized protein n=1 Tax=Scophthalmus maximus TaxID=52904 RepID=A0A2U9BL97_SCOMX|nr:Hypothetical protein SMAX5B_016278 [Scophthalmus maximus]
MGATIDVNWFTQLCSTRREEAGPIDCAGPGVIHGSPWTVLTRMTPLGFPGHTYGSTARDSGGKRVRRLQLQAAAGNNGPECSRQH